MDLNDTKPMINF